MQRKDRLNDKILRPFQFWSMIYIHVENITPYAPMRVVVAVFEDLSFRQGLYSMNVASLTLQKSLNLLGK